MTKSSNIDYRKWQKKNLVLQIIRQNPNISRSSVKEMSGFSMESVLQYIDELLAENLIVNAGISDSVVGRKATMLQINPFGCYFIGIRFNANALTGVVMDFGGEAIRKKQVTFPSNIEAAAVIDAIFTCIQELLDSLSAEKGKVRGIGVAVPGYVNNITGIATLYVHIRDWKDVPLRQLVEDRFGLRTYVDQNVKAIALALKMEPENREIRDMLFILAGRGVGMVIIANNEICNGYDNGAGEIGHVFVTDNGLTCECGKQGCLETEVSQIVILRRLAEGLQAGRHPVLRKLLKNDRKPTIKDFLHSIELADPDSISLLQDVCKYLSRAVATAVTLLNPRKIIFSGELVQASGFLDMIQDEIERHCPADSIKSLTLQIRNRDDVSNALGAAMLAYYNQFGADEAAVSKRSTVQV